MWTTAETRSCSNGSLSSHRATARVLCSVGVSCFRVKWHPKWFAHARSQTNPTTANHSANAPCIRGLRVIPSHATQCVRVCVCRQTAKRVRSLFRKLRRDGTERSPRFWFHGLGKPIPHHSLDCLARSRRSRTRRAFALTPTWLAGWRIVTNSFLRRLRKLGQIGASFGAGKNTVRPPKAHPTPAKKRWFEFCARYDELPCPRLNAFTFFLKGYGLRQATSTWIRNGQIDVSGFLFFLSLSLSLSFPLLSFAGVTKFISISKSCWIIHWP